MDIDCVVQLDRISDFDSEGCRFEPCRGHFFKRNYLLTKGLRFLFFSLSQYLVSNDEKPKNPHTFYHKKTSHF